MNSFKCSLKFSSIRATLFIVTLMMLSACGNKSERDLEQEQASGIVLVQNKSYYEVKLPNGNSIYFNDYDAEEGIKGLAFDADSVEVAKSYGTGFFIGSDGLIATNSHVVSSSIDDKEVKKSVKDIFNGLKYLMELEYNSKLEELKEIQYAYDIANYSDEVSFTDFYTIQNIRDQAIAELEEMKDTYRALDRLELSDSEIKYHNEVSIAYNDTHVTKESDFIDCVIRDKDEDHDLAVLQLKDKKTPDDKYVFTIPEEDPFETYSIFDNISKAISGDKNEKLYLHGFNLGPQLAITEEGLKAQFTNGTVSQQTSDRLMYSIPTLPGSSGSPVVNGKGELIAINFAGLSGTQNFNYGVRVKHLRNLINR